MTFDEGTPRGLHITGDTIRNSVRCECGDRPGSIPEAFQNSPDCEQPPGKCHGLNKVMVVISKLHKI